jgi:hypothetical protein
MRDALLALTLWFLCAKLRKGQEDSVPHRLAYRVLELAPVLCLPLLLGAPAGAQQSPAPRSAGGETVEVNIRIVPFCSVDAAGKPIYDLRQDEVELRVGGQPVTIDTLDRTAAAPGGTGTGETAGTARQTPPAAPGPPRTVIFFFDSAFTSPAGVRNARVVAEKLLREIPEGQRLSLWFHSAARGLEQKVTSVNADARGRRQFLAALGKLLPEVDRLGTGSTEELGLSIGSASRSRGGSQLNGSINAAQTTARSEYEGMARELAGALDVMAAELRHLHGPKLFLVFWQGLDADLFFQGDMGMKPTSTEGYVVGGQRYGALMTHFTAPLQAIGDSGAVTVFVNATAPEGVDADTDGPIRQMAQTAGASYVGGADAVSVEQRVAATTAACYEAGFYIRGRTTAAREPVEVVVKRPGARTWAPAALRLRETWETLTATEKKLLVLDLAAGGPQAQRGPVALSVEQLEGTVQSHPEGRGGRRLRYQAAWPAALAGKQLDLYNVALARPAKGEKAPRLLKFDSHEKAATSAADALEVDLGRSDSLIWAIVAVEPATGRAWYRRLQLAGPEAPRAPGSQ